MKEEMKIIRKYLKDRKEVKNIRDISLETEKGNVLVEIIKRD